MRLSPFVPALFMMQGGIAFAHYLAGHYDSTIDWAENSQRENGFASGISTSSRKSSNQ